MDRKLAAVATVLALVLLLVPGTPVLGQDAPTFSPEQIEQLVAPIALYPDDLVSQILMASTYPLEVIEASRWASANKNVKGDSLANALKSKPWDPSVKSLVNVPQVLDMMDKKLDWMQGLGNAFLAQQKDVMDAIQRLRKKAVDAGNLKSSQEQTVTTEGETIVIEPAEPDVIYVPVYDPGIIYGSWPYPRYPPYYYYPPGWRPHPTPYAFAAGLAIGAAWGYAWGHCNWHSCDVDIDINRNVNRNRNIDRGWYRNKMESTGIRGGKGAWQHDVNHRRGAGYGDARTAQRYNRGSSPNAASREAYRGRPGSGGGASPGTRPSAGQRPHTRPTAQPTRQSGAFGGYDRGSNVRQQSSRGRTSRQSYGSRGGSRGGGARRGGGGGGRR